MKLKLNGMKMKIKMNHILNLYYYIYLQEFGLCELNSDESEEESDNEEKNEKLIEEIK